MRVEYSNFKLFYVKADADKKERFYSATIDVVTEKGFLWWQRDVHTTIRVDFIRGVGWGVYGSNNLRLILDQSKLSLLLNLWAEAKIDDEIVLYNN